MHDPIRVLVTAVGSTTAISVIKGLRKANSPFHIMGVDTNHADEVAGSSFCDAFYSVPRASETSYVPELLELCITQNIAVIVPVVDLEVEILALHQNKFNKHGVQVLASSAEVVAACNDKEATYRRLLKNGLTTTKTVSLEDFLKSEKYPAFLKPRRGLSSHGAHRISSRQELDRYIDDEEDLVVQPLLTGEMYVIDVVADRNSKVFISCPRIELEAKSGLGVKAKTVSDLALQKYATSVTETMGIVGPANIEVMKHENTVSLIEINPRFSAGSILSTHVGTNIHEAAVLMILGKNYQESLGEWKPGCMMTRYWEEVFYDHSI